MSFVLHLGMGIRDVAQCCVCPLTNFVVLPVRRIKEWDKYK